MWVNILQSKIVIFYILGCKVRSVKKKMMDMYMLLLHLLPNTKHLPTYL
jgi:hypothetical protein